MELLYDVAHNIAKLEEHTVAGKKKRVWVHRKERRGHSRRGIRSCRRRIAVGQPVIIPGDMGRASWVLVGHAPGAWSGRSVLPSRGPAGR